jgi:hypothetical protein
MRKLMCHACIGLMVLSLGFATNPVFGSDNSIINKADWNNLSQLWQDQEIRIKQKDAKTIRGTFRSFSDEAIVLMLTSGDQTISRANVRRISIKRNGHRGRNVLVGASIGAGAGGGAGAGYKGCPAGNDCIVGPNRGQAIAIGIALGAIAGTIVGAVIPTGGWRDIYKAR